MAIKADLTITTNDGLTKSRVITFKTDGTAGNTVNVGFKPNYVRVMNLTTGNDRFEWYRGFAATNTIKNGSGAFDTTSAIVVDGTKVTVGNYADNNVILLEVR